MIIAILRTTLDHDLFGMSLNFSPDVYGDNKAVKNIKFEGWASSRFLGFNDPVTNSMDNVGIQEVEDTLKIMRRIRRLTDQHRQRFGYNGWIAPVITCEMFNIKELRYFAVGKWQEPHRGLTRASDLVLALDHAAEQLQKAREERESK